MRWRWVSIFLLVQQAVWLGVLLPGHQRGAMAVAGWAKPAATATGGCCGTTETSADVTVATPSCHAPPAKSVKGDGKPAGGPTDATAHCAVCFVALRMTVATPPDLAPTAAKVADVLPPDRPSARPALQITPTYLACGPPSA